MMEKVRTHVVISGRVQGVFYRMETKRAAEVFGVVGWVRNLKNGDVEAVMEGKKNDVDALIKWCRTGPAMAGVTKVDVNRQTYSGGYTGFDVRW